MGKISSLYRPVSIGSLQLEGNLFLAPVAGYTDRSFRSLCIEQGANFSFTELISAEALHRNPGHYGLGAEGFLHTNEVTGSTTVTGKTTNQAAFRKAASMVSRAHNEQHYAIQLFGAQPLSMYKAALMLAPLKPDVVDINAGCPVPKVVKNGAGSALMKDPVRLGKVVEAVVEASRQALGNVPVTVKIRSGWDTGSINYADCGRIAVEAGASMVSLHPRTRNQGYSGKSDWSCIADLASRLSVPVAGSGDLFTPEDAGRMFAETGCAALMFARGAEGNPFIFPAARSFLASGSWEPVAFKERIDVAFRHLDLLAADIGENAACREMRKQFCAYTKGPPGKTGMPGSAGLRNRLVYAQTIQDYRVIIDDFLDKKY